MKLTTKLFLFATFVAVSFNSNLSFAQSNEGGRLDIEEIIVTGTKRDVSQQDVPIAVSTLTAKQLDNTFRNDVFALGQLAPNVTLTPQNGFNAIAGGMRGTGFISILVTKDPSVGVVVDDFAFNHVQAQAIEMFDMEQVEIYRGPQGTLFGKNTTGGAISFTTKKPVLGETFFDLETSYGQYSSNDASIEKISAAVNFPIGDTIAVRLSVIQDEEEGFYTNNKSSGNVVSFGGPGSNALFSQGGQINDVGTTQNADGTFTSVGNGAKIGGKDVLAAKLKVRFEPSEFYRADFTYEYLDDSSDAPATANDTPGGGAEAYLFPNLGFPGYQDGPNPGNPFSTGESQTCNTFTCIGRGHAIEVEGFYLTQTFNFDNFTLKSITGIRDQDEVLNSTYTGESYTSLYDAARNTAREQTQQEFRITSNFDGAFNFVAGAAYYEDNLEFVVFGNLGFVDLVSPAGTSGALQFANVAEIQATAQDRETTAFYIDASFDITDQIKLTVGARHTEDEKKFSRQQFASDGAGFALIFTPDQYLGPWTNPIPKEDFGLNYNADKDFEGDTWRVVLDYQLDEDTLLYGSIATGFVSGGFAETCGSVFTCQPYNDEENTNIEFGFKADRMDGRLRFNGAIFQTEYESLQRDSVITRLVGDTQFQETASVNEGETTATGFEIEFQYLATENLRIDGFLGLLDHEYDVYAPGLDAGSLLTGAASGVTMNPDLSGLSVPFSPETTAGLTLTYFQDLQSGGTLTYSASVHYRDEFELSPFPANGEGGTIDNPIIRQKRNTQAEERTLVNAYVTWDMNDNVALTLWGRNLTDETHRISANPVAALWNFTRYGAPRSIGLKAALNF
tara:strand:+ start:159 stop:2696 length:2538 start_codon:yes stop_codon:yes gene_type:complete